MLLHYSVNAGEASRSPRKVHGIELRSDLGYEGSSTVSSDLGCGGLSTTATSTHSPSHLVERYQKMSMHPLAEGKLRYART